MYARVEVISTELINPTHADAISFTCSQDVFRLLNLDWAQEHIVFEQKEILEKALDILWVIVSDEDWENIRFSAVTLH